MLEALDYHADENAAPGLSLLPSEYFRRQMYACFWFENGPSLINAIQRLGVDNCMFETDFPHPTCLLPEPLRSAVPTFKNVGRLFPPQGVQRERRTRLQPRPRRALTNSIGRTVGRISTGLRET